GVLRRTQLVFGGGGRAGGPGPAIGLVDVRANLAEGLPLAAEPHHVTRDVETDGSGCRVTGIGYGPVPVHALDVAVAIVAVADVLAPAEAGDVVEGLAVLEGVPVCPLNLGTARSREVRKLAAGHGLDLIAVLVAGHRPCGRLAARQPPGTTSRDTDQSCGEHVPPGRALAAPDLLVHRHFLHD